MSNEDQKIIDRAKLYGSKGALMDGARQSLNAAARLCQHANDNMLEDFRVKIQAAKEAIRVAELFYGELENLK